MELVNKHFQDLICIPLETGHIGFFEVIAIVAPMLRL